MHQRATTQNLRLSSPTEVSPSGLWRTLGKRVGLTPSRVRIPHPPPATFASRSEEPVPEIGFRARRAQRRNRMIQIGAGVLALYCVGFLTGFLVKQVTTVPVAGSTPVSCITLAIIPNDILPKPNAVTLNILNGSDRVGMATITADIFKSRNFKINKIGNFSDYPVTGTAEIHFGPAGSDAAKLAAAYIENSVLVEDDRTDSSVDVIVGQTFSDVLTTADARDYLSRPIASPSGPGC